MLKPRMKFSALRQLLLGFGFQEVPGEERFIRFERVDPDFWIVFPHYRGNALVAPRHLAQVRIMLDGLGLMEADDFDRLVGVSPVRQPVRS